MNKFKQFLTEAAESSSNFNRAFGGLRSLLSNKAPFPEIVKFCSQNFKFDERFQEQVLPYIKSYGPDCGDEPYYAETDDEFVWQFRLCKWPGLKVLSLSNSELGDRGLEELSQSRFNFPRVNTLFIHGTRITDEGVRNFVKRGGMFNLASLYLSGTSITDKSLEIIASAPDVMKISLLSVESTGITDKGIEYLMSNGKFRDRLRDLQIGYNRIGDEGLLALSRMSDVLNLEYLDLSGLSISDDAAKELSEGEWIKLKELTIEECEISDQGFDYLQTNLEQPFDLMRGPIEINYG